MLKLKEVRELLRGLTHQVSNATARVGAARGNVEILQLALRQDPLNTQLFADSTIAQAELDKWLKVEESILKQKAKIHWLKC